MQPTATATLTESQATQPVRLRGDVLAVSLVIHLLALALPLALLQVYDRILPSQSFGTATLLLLGVAIAIALEAVLRYGRTALFANLGARYEAAMTWRAIGALHSADVDAVEQRGGAAINDAFRAIAEVRDFWSGQAGAALYEAPFVVVYLLLIAYLGGWLALIPLALFILALLLAFHLNGRIRTHNARIHAHDRKRRDLAWTGFASLAHVKALGAENAVARLYRRLTDRYLADSVELESAMGWLRENATALGQLATVLIVTFGALEVMAGDLTTGGLAACTMLAGRSIGPAMASLGYWSQIARITEAQSRVNDLLNLPQSHLLANGKRGASPQVLRGEIELEAPMLLAEPLTVAPGEVVHLASADASRASHLLSAIAGLTHDLEIGVRVDGHVISDYAEPDYRNNVVLVTGQLALVPGSILNNLTLFDPRYNARAKEYSESLGLQQHLDRLRHGILTDVGPSTAAQLDEGIYQRIALIRALVRQPKIMLLDHAASGLDLDGIKRLAAVLESLRGGTTVLLASHNEPLVASCTRRVELQREART